MTGKAIVLLSGGLDSATCLALAQDRGSEVVALSFDYGQRSQSELAAAKRVAKAAAVTDHRVIHIGLDSMGGSALTDSSIPVPDTDEALAAKGIPVTYVPARNTIFLSYALGLAEVLNAQSIYIGVNALDYSGYPDCRPAFIDAFQALIKVATKAGVEGQTIELETPLIDLSKAEIIQTADRLGVDFSLTVSCYQADEDGAACGVCDSCRLRKAGFLAAGIKDPTLYKAG